MSALPKPFCVDSDLVKSLHFDLSETQSRMSLRDPDALLLKYTKLMMGCLLFNPTPARIAMIGLGGGSLVKFCYRHLPDAVIEVAENNPRVLALRDEFKIPPDDARLAIHLADGAEFLRHPRFRHALDLVMLDAYDPSGIPEHLCTQGFYNDCRRTLKPGGVVVVNLFRGVPDYDTYIERIRAAFDSCLLTVIDHKCSNDIVFAWADPLVDQHLVAQTRPAEIARPVWSQLASVMEKTREAWQERQTAP